jgi:hypothetical protein
MPNKTRDQKPLASDRLLDLLLDALQEREPNDRPRLRRPRSQKAGALAKKAGSRRPGCPLSIWRECCSAFSP